MKPWKPLPVRTPWLPWDDLAFMLAGCALLGGLMMRNGDMQWVALGFLVVALSLRVVRIFVERQDLPEYTAQAIAQHIQKYPELNQLAHDLDVMPVQTWRQALRLQKYWGRVARNQKKQGKF